MHPREVRTAACLLALLSGWISVPEWAWAGDFDEVATYQALCASCHGERRYGGYAPPLVPSTLERKSDAALVEAILRGLPNTQMAPFAGQLDDTQAHALVGFLRRPVGEIRWTISDIAASRVVDPPGPGKIPPTIDRAGLILVVERGSGSVVVLDGDRMQELDRFPVGRIHGGIKFDRGLHRAFSVTRDGTLVEYDLDVGRARSRVKVGVNTRNIAVSSDGRFVAAANQLPQGLVVLDGGLEPIALHTLPGQPSAVYQLPGSPRFVLTLRDLPLLFYVNPHAPAPDQELQQVALPEPFEDFIFVPGRSQLVASSRRGRRLILYDYAKDEILARLATEGLPHLFSASFFIREGTLHAAFNHMGAPRLSIIDMERFELAKQIPLAGAGYFTRTHAGTRYLWIDTNTDTIQLVDKSSLELLERDLVPEPGKKAMHVEFTADGRQALVSVWHDEGAVVVYDSNDLHELHRIPFEMPVGKYNAANKTRAFR
ncbi:MAG: c-type cytochrome [Deltaproteobacteria bacterium]|nr:c-type cytochrome [Deltaproteobacteria bacterium]